MSNKQTTHIAFYGKGEGLKRLHEDLCSILKPDPESRICADDAAKSIPSLMKALRLWDDSISNIGDIEAISLIEKASGFKDVDVFFIRQAGNCNSQLSWCNLVREHYNDAGSPVLYECFSDKEMERYRCC